jgi:hypothetical protein
VDWLEIAVFMFLFFGAWAAIANWYNRHFDRNAYESDEYYRRMHRRQGRSK